MRAENPGQLAKTIQYVYDHPVEALEMGLKAREKCKREYSWDVMEKKLIAIFENYRAKRITLDKKEGRYEISVRDM